MFTWIKAIFGSIDRQQAAADRAAKAMEDVADMIESARDQLRVRLVEAPGMPPAVEDRSDPEPSRNGKRRAASV